MNSTDIHPPGTHLAIQTVAIFANPIAGRGKGRSIALLLEERLQKVGIRAHTILDSPSLVKVERFADADALIVIGGDGTLRAVAGRCLHVLGHIPPLLPVPMGTANLMARHLAIRWAPSEVVERVLQSIRNGKISLLDAAQANGEPFLVMAGVGIDALIVHELDRNRNDIIQYASYLLPAAVAIRKYQYTPLSVKVDGNEVFASAPAMAFVANISQHGIGFPLLPNARPDDGLLDVCVIPVASLVEATEQLLRAAAGEHLLGEGVISLRGREIDIESLRPVPVQVDGDPAGYTPVRIGLLPAPVPFIVPA